MFVIHPETRTVYRVVNLNQSMNAKFEVFTASVTKIQFFSGIRCRALGSKLLQNVDSHKWTRRRKAEYLNFQARK